MDKIAILKKFSFYNTAPAEIRRMFEQEAIYKHGDRGEFFFHEGDKCSFIAFFGKGSIRVYKLGELGREITLYHVRPGESCVLNMTCTLAQIPYPANAEVETETELVLFPARRFREWVGRLDSLRDFSFSLLARRISQMMTLLEEISFKKMDVRLAEFLLQRFDNEGKPLRILHLTHEQIAAELGTAREVVSRLLQEFQRMGAVELARGRIKLNNERFLKSSLK